MQRQVTPDRLPEYAAVAGCQCPVAVCQQMYSYVRDAKGQTIRLE